MAEVSKVEKTCEHCEQPYLVVRRKETTSRFCSVTCKNEGAKKDTITPCPVCGVEVRGSRRIYCSREHYEQDRIGKPRKFRKDSGQKRAPWKLLTCDLEECTNTFERRVSEMSEKNYCSHSCFRKDAWRFGFKGGRSNTPIGTRRPNSRGEYVWIKAAEGSLGWKLEHIYVMEQKEGRSLLPGENVHHMNGKKDDNRPENLELWITKQPKGQRVPDLVEYAKEILARYEPDALA